MEDLSFNAYMIYVVIVSALLAIIPAMIANKKGYKPFIFWLMGFILFPVALIWVLVMKPGYLKRCPYCAEEIHQNAKICRFCGREI